MAIAIFGVVGGLIVWAVVFAAQRSKAIKQIAADLRTVHDEALRRYGALS